MCDLNVLMSSGNREPSVTDCIFACPLRNLYVEALTPRVAVFGNGASKGVIKVKRGLKALIR